MDNAAARFSQSEHAAILKFVRGVIAANLAGENLPARPEIALLAEPGSCFVTLHDADGELRGCIGNIEAFEPLGENLIRNALNAAFSDPRFPLLDPEELPEISLEVSILTPPRTIASPAEFRVGTDGIILRVGGRGAVFLPQVAPEQGWDRETTLAYLSRKAGLPSDGWRSPEARFALFQAEVFSEA